ncbi:MAG TPA: DUF488 family protein [Dehalococcoidia bacterium]|nr:DUF488 family protein [Dehalococcoidia bacterium]
MSVRIKRAYDPPARGDGYRVLVDRLWPRGLRKDDLRLDAWLKDLGPSNGLRTWFAHDPDRWPEFQRRYRQELRAKERQDVLRDLAARAGRGTITLVFAAKDAPHSNAAVLQPLIERMSARATVRRPG